MPSMHSYNNRYGHLLLLVIILSLSLLATARTHYEVLEIQEDATQADIKSAFRKMSLLHHPDRNFGIEDPADAHRVYLSIVEAYEVLSDEEKKKSYDMELSFNKGDNIHFAWSGLQNVGGMIGLVMRYVGEGTEFSWGGGSGLPRGKYVKRPTGLQKIA